MKKRIITFGIVLWFTLSLFCVACDADVSMVSFITIKLIAISSLIVSVAVGKILDRKGLLLTNNTDDDVSL